MLYAIDNIRIDGATYSVEWLESPDIPKACVAAVSYEKQKICIYKSHPEHDLQSLLHEIVHVINYNRLGEKLEESEINTIGCSLAQIILDNVEEIITMAGTGLTEIESDDDHEDLEL